jgi:hypothetical protein
MYAGNFKYNISSDLRLEVSAAQQKISSATFNSLNKDLDVVVEAIEIKF